MPENILLNFSDSTLFQISKFDILDSMMANNMNLLKVKKNRGRLIGWYIKNQRKLPWRETRDAYRIWVSEVMLQQTQVKTVLPYYEAFIRRFPDVITLSGARQQTVLKVWEGLGYYARCRNLHHAAKVVRNEYAGRIPNDMEAFRKLPGVGEYIAAAVMSIAFNQPFAVVDGNVKRVLARLFEIDAPVNKSNTLKIFRSVAQTLLDSDQPGTFNQAVMELGALVCKPKAPDCIQCPVHSACEAYKNQTTGQYPIRVQSKPTPVYRLTAGVIIRKGKILITRRPSEGLLGGLWEFPGGKIGEGEKPETSCIREIKKAVNLTVNIVNSLTQVRHAYTHFRIVMDVFLCKSRSGAVKLNGAADYRWVTVSALKNYPFSKASHKFIPLLHSTRLQLR